MDPVPLKTCNWNCVYCQLGRTAPLTGVRGVYAAADQIIDEVRQALENARRVDWITFVGSGEPVLHTQIGWMIRQIKAFTAKPVAVITNGSLLYRSDVRTELLATDAVLPSLDAGTASLYRAVNRPHPEFTFDRLVNGLVEFRRMYSGKLWVEVMLIRGFNDSEKDLRNLARVMAQVQPDEVHLSLPVRPPAEAWVTPPEESVVERAGAILGEVARILPAIHVGFDLAAHVDAMEAVMGVISRHPMSEEDLLRTLERFKPGEVCAVLGKLGASGRAQVVNRYGRRFWSAASGHYGSNGGGRKAPSIEQTPKE